MIEETLLKAKLSDKPVLIRVKTTIGYLSNKQNSSKSHGAPLGLEEVKRLRKLFGFENYNNFEFPKELIEECKKISEKGIESENKWNIIANNYKNNYPDKYSEFIMETKGILKKTKYLPSFNLDDKKMATRDISGNCIQKITDNIGNLIIGSSDLSPSNKTLFNDDIIIQNNYNGSYLH